MSRGSLHKMLSHKVSVEAILNPADMKFINFNKGIIKGPFGSRDSLDRVAGMLWSYNECTSWKSDFHSSHWNMFVITGLNSAKWISFYLATILAEITAATTISGREFAVPRAKHLRDFWSPSFFSSCRDRLFKEILRIDCFCTAEKYNKINLLCFAYFSLLARTIPHRRRNENKRNY